MASKTHRQYGLWDSPIAPASLASGIKVSDVAWNTDGETLVWIEERSGRGVLVCQKGTDAPRELTDTISVRADVGGHHLAVGLSLHDAA